VPVERVEEERPRLRQDLVHVADDEESPDLAALATLARDLDRKLDDLLERAPARLAAVCALAHRPERIFQPILALVPGHHLSQRGRGLL
jgi:hypothetical protein